MTQPTITHDAIALAVERNRRHYEASIESATIMFQQKEAAQQKLCGNLGHRWAWIDRGDTRFPACSVCGLPRHLATPPIAREEPVEKAPITIGDRLRAERMRLQLNLDRTAFDVGVGRRTLVGWEGGRSAPNAEDLQHFQAIGFDVLYIVTGQRDARLAALGVGSAS